MGCSFGLVRRGVRREFSDMQRRIPLGLVCLFSLFALAGCGQQEQKPVVVAVNQASEAKTTEVPNTPKVDWGNVALPVLTPQAKYDANVANAYRLLSERKLQEAL